MPNRNGNGEILTLPCGRCATCRSKKRFEWVLRMELEDMTAITTWFITLTYDDDKVPRKNGYTVLEKSAPINFIRRLKKLEAKTPKQHRLPTHDSYGDKYKIRYLQVGEYGSKTYRPHYHLIVWNVSKYAIDRVSRAWKNGFVKAETPRDGGAVATYTAKYVMKEHAEIDFKEPPFKSQSNSIGLKHALRHPQMIKDGMLHRGKFKIPIPKWWRDKFYTQEEWDYVKDLCYLRKQEAETQYYDKLLKELEGSFEDAWEHVESSQLRYLEHQERLINKKTLNAI